jgi:NADH-quinone oxidoreductase subunit D
MAVFLYAFREREELMDCYEAVSGARMHATYYRPGGVYRDLPDRMPKYKESPLAQGQRAQAPQRMARRLDARFPRAVLRRLPIRSTNTKPCSPTTASGSSAPSASAWSVPEQALAWGMTGPMLRGSGVAWDLRKKQPYAKYAEVDFDIPVGTNGDCYDRYLVRVEEMRQSNRIIQQCVAWLRANQGPVMLRNFKVVAAFA